LDDQGYVFSDVIEKRQADNAAEWGRWRKAKVRSD